MSLPGIIDDRKNSSLKKFTLPKKIGSVVGGGVFADNFIFWSSKGLMTCDMDGAEIETTLKGSLVTAFCTQENIQVAAIYKKGIAVRNGESDWKYFPAGKKKSRVNGMCIIQGTLWISQYGGGLYRMNLQRLMELEGLVK